MEKAVIENHKRYLERETLYKSFGYDIKKERAFIIKKAEPLYGDILEVGTGKGYLTLALAGEGHSFTSVDISEEEQELARLNVKYAGLEKQVDFKVENAERLSFENGRFDVIFSVNVVHHLIKPFKVINELIRIVSFEGKIIISDFTKEGLEVIDKIHISEGKKHELNKMNLADVHDYLCSKKFSVDKCRSEFQEVLIAYQPNI